MSSPGDTADADESLREFIELMAAAGNPGADRHEVGVHKVVGWILDYDSALGGSEVQSMIGVDGAIHARRGPRSVRARRLTASEWLAREPDDEPHAPTAAVDFADRLRRILAFNGAVDDTADGET